MWVIGRMNSDGERQLLQWPDGSAMGFNSKDDAEKIISARGLGPEAFAFDAGEGRAIVEGTASKH